MLDALLAGEVDAILGGTALVDHEQEIGAGVDRSGGPSRFWLGT